MDKLDTYLAQCNTEFKWLEHDCITFIRGWLLVHTGQDLVPEQPKHSTLLSGLRELRSKGGYAGVGDRFGAAISPAFAQRGDVVLMPSGLPIRRASGYTYGVCTGMDVAVPGTHGIVLADITEGIKAWRVSSLRVKST